MIQAVRGTKDLTPEQIDNWYYLENACRSVSELYGYREIRTPIFEKTEVFSRSIGEATDIVNKEMYTFLDKGGDSITLRPEKTAALVRSVIQNSLDRNLSTLRLWYFGPFFRYERPQKGRLRQFHQFGAECISSPYPESDFEVISLCDTLIKTLGFQEYTLLLNTLGNSLSRENYKKNLVEYLTKHKEGLSYDSQTRFEKNPLRILDSKDPNDIEILKNAPSIMESMDEESLKHFESVKLLLDSANIKYNITPSLVRGLDYYSHTVFEFRSNALGAQDSFGGGGRYDGLFEQLGGKPTPAIGFAMGIERLLLIMEASKLLPESKPIADCFIILQNPAFAEYSNKVSDALRKRGLRTIVELQRRSVKAQFKESDKLNTNFAIVIGEEEANSNTVIIKNMKNSTQEKVNLSIINEFDFNS